MYAFSVFNYTLNMKIKEFTEDKLTKYFDELDRIIKIDFHESGNYCMIAYKGDTNEKASVIWSNGYQYTYGTKFGDNTWTERKY